MDIRRILLRGTSAVAFLGAHTAWAQETTQPSEESPIGDIVVTATRRTDSMQKVPISIQAIDSATLKSANIQSFQDYIARLPNVNFGGRGPGQNDIYIRGLASNKVGIQLSGAQGTAPNVALYLDDQPVTLTGRNLDIYVTDMERIEVLSGPQGTLFGASSQAGNVRLITNKPKLDALGVGITAGTSFTKHGDMSTSLEAYGNVPIIADKLAIRIAAYDVHNGGYIDNVQGRQTLSPSNPFFPAGATLGFADNTALVEKNFNDSSYQGFRAGVKYQVNEDWSLLLQHSRQDLEADGVFDYDPAVGDLQVKRYYPDELHDKYNQTSWNIEGRLGPLSLIYTGGYIHRTVFQRLDYTGYGNVGPFIPYYVCNYPSYTRCGNPTLGFIGHVNSRRWNHEFRVSTPSEWRFRFTAGAYYDRGKTTDQGDFDYPETITQGFALNRPLPGSTASNPDFRAPGIAFINDYTRRDHQLSFFGEASFDIIPEKLTLTAGLRRYHLVYSLAGSTSFASRGAIDGDFGVNVDNVLADISPKTENGFVPRVTLTWKPTDQLLFYTTFSQGFRPGGFNRAGGTSNDPSLGIVPFAYVSDKVDNYEAGWKTTLFDGHVRWNGTAYYMKWRNMQVTAQIPAISQLFFTDNAADARIKGVETDLTIAPDSHWQLRAALSYNHTELTHVGAGIISVAPVGSSLAQSPKFQGNLSIRHTWDLGDGELYAEASGQFASRSYSSLQISERFPQRAYGIVNFAIGYNKDQWTAQLYVNNITDKRAQLYVNTQDHTQRVTTNRPLTVGLKLGYEM